MRKRLPTDAAGLGDIVFLGVVNTVIPFTLITWGEKTVESGLASVLQGTAALFTLVLAHVPKEFGETGDEIAF